MEQVTLLKPEDQKNIEFMNFLNEIKKENEEFKKEILNLKNKLEPKEEPEPKKNVLVETEKELEDKNKIDKEIENRVNAKAKILEFQKTKESELGEVAKHLLGKINNLVNVNEIEKANYLDIILLVDKYKKDASLKEYINEFDKPVFEEFEFILKNQSSEIFEFSKSQELLKAIAIAETVKAKIEDAKKLETKKKYFLGGSEDKETFKNYKGGGKEYLNLLLSGIIK